MAGEVCTQRPLPQAVFAQASLSGSANILFAKDRTLLLRVRVGKNSFDFSSSSNLDCFLGQYGEKLNKDFLKTFKLFAGLIQEAVKKHGNIIKEDDFLKFAKSYEAVATRFKEEIALIASVNVAAHLSYVSTDGELVTKSDDSKEVADLKKENKRLEESLSEANKGKPDDKGTWFSVSKDQKPYILGIGIPAAVTFIGGVFGGIVLLGRRKARIASQETAQKKDAELTQKVNEAVKNAVAASEGEIRVLKEVLERVPQQFGDQSSLQGQQLSAKITEASLKHGQQLADLTRRHADEINDLRIASDKKIQEGLTKIAGLETQLLEAKNKRDEAVQKLQTADTRQGDAELQAKMAQEEVRRLTAELTLAGNNLAALEQELRALKGAQGTSERPTSQGKAKTPIPPPAPKPAPSASQSAISPYFTRQTIKMPSQALQVQIKDLQEQMTKTADAQVRESIRINIQVVRMAQEFYKTAKVVHQVRHLPTATSEGLDSKLLLLLSDDEIQELKDLKDARIRDRDLSQMIARKAISDREKVTAIHGQLKTVVEAMPQSPRRKECWDALEEIRKKAGLTPDGLKFSVVSGPLLIPAQEREKMGDIELDLTDEAIFDIEKISDFSQVYISMDELDRATSRGGKLHKTPDPQSQAGPLPPPPPPPGRKAAPAVPAVTGQMPAAQVEALQEEARRASAGFHEPSPPTREMPAADQASLIAASVRPSSRMTVEPPEPPGPPSSPTRDSVARNLEDLRSDQGGEKKN